MTPAAAALRERCRKFLSTAGFIGTAMTIPGPSAMDDPPQRVTFPAEARTDALAAFVAQEVAAAEERERERCVQIAERHCHDYSLGGMPAFGHEGSGPEGPCGGSPRWESSLGSGAVKECDPCDIASALRAPAPEVRS